MDLSKNGELLESVLNQLIDEESLGVCFEMHRAVKLNYYELLYPDDSEGKPPYCPDLVNVKGLDIFGNAPNAMKKPVDCVCPNCSRMLGAQKFAPHLEKCMGMGRNSSRLATKKNKALADSEQEGSDDYEEEWTYPERKPFPTQGKKQPKKFGTSGNSPKPLAGKTSLKPLKDVDSLQLKVHPSIQQHNVDTFACLSMDCKHTLLQQICGVVSERTGRLCTRSINCPQHTEDQRLDVRKRLLATQDQESADLMTSPFKRRLEADDLEPYHELSVYENVLSEDPLEGTGGRSLVEEGPSLLGSSPDKTPRKVIKLEKKPRKLGVVPSLPSSLFSSSHGTTSSF